MLYSPMNIKADLWSDEIDKSEFFTGPQKAVDTNTRRDRQGDEIFSTASRKAFSLNGHIL